MSIFDRLQNLLKAKPVERSPEDIAREEELRERLRDRCKRFRRLLSANKSALEAMREIEARLEGGEPCGTDFLHEVTERVTSSVSRMIRDIDVLSDNAFPKLNIVFESIREKILDLQKSAADSDSPFILPLSAIGEVDAPKVGPKMANLGEIASRAGLMVPEGFAVTVSAYNAFMDETGLREKLKALSQGIDPDNLDDLLRLSQTMQQTVIATALPPKLEKEISQAVEAMAEDHPNLLLALRSSAIGEDSLGMSFAGQYHSALNVPVEEAVHVYKEIIASKYTLTALSYRLQHGISDDDAPMGVGVLAMIPSQAGGVAYSIDPVAAGRGEEQVLINAVHGLAKGVVDGATNPDVFVFSHNRPPELVRKSRGGQQFSLTDGEAAKIANIALVLEEYHNEAQDVEWAIDAETQKVAILQSRPLRLMNAGDMDADTLRDEDLRSLPAPLAEGGVTVSHGAAIGPAFVVRKEADMLAFPQGGILVIERALPRWAPLLPRAAGIISENGGMAGHLASVAREYSVPGLFGLHNACSVLDKAGEITLDAARHAVYPGSVPILLETSKKQPRRKNSSHIRLERIASLITPLHLLDPDSDQFTPGHCQTLHDITRFCHEKAVELIFEADPLTKSMGRQLKAGVKLQYWLIDIGGGFRKTTNDSFVDISEISSKPMLALWEGMLAVPWAGPPASTSGFMSVMLQSTMNPDLEVTAPNAMAEKNFFIVSDTYMLLQARYGYHFCTVESMAGKDNHENFVNFQFSGGAADKKRRQLRASMVGELLEVYGFRVEVRDDGLFAVAEDFSTEEILMRTRLLGYLLIHTRQVDMIMLDYTRANALKEELQKNMAKIAGSHADAQS